MNKKILTTLTIFSAILMATPGFTKKTGKKTAPPNIETISFTKKNDLKNKYVRLSTAFLEDRDGYILAPSVGYGYRVMNKGSGVDISVNYAGRRSRKRFSSYCSIPTLLYLNNLSSHSSKNSNFYYGMGGSLGGQVNHGQEFFGLYANGALGYEVAESNRVKILGQIDCAYPILPVYQRGEKITHPTVSFGLGLGF